MWALTAEEMKEMPVAKTPPRRAGRVYRVDPGRAPETCEFRWATE